MATNSNSTSKGPSDSPSDAASPSTSKGPSPSTSKGPSPSTSKGPLPSTSKGPVPSTSKGPFPSTSKWPWPSTSKGPCPSTSQASCSSPIRTLGPSNESTDAPAGPAGHTPSKMERRMSQFKEYKFFRSFSAKVENWPMRKAEQLWRNMREKKIAEIEAEEACVWLRAAGFPQYAQIYEDNAGSKRPAVSRPPPKKESSDKKGSAPEKKEASEDFLIKVDAVIADHPFLDPESLLSLTRRLRTLNRCYDMKLDSPRSHKKSNESDDEQCALSDQWQFERKSRRWSRLVEISPEAHKRLEVIAAAALAEKEAREARGEVEDDQDNSLPVIEVGMVDNNGKYTRAEPKKLPVPNPPREMQSLSDREDEDATNTRLRRTGSERLRDGAKALLRRVESIKTRRRKNNHRKEVIFPPKDLNVEADEYPDLNYIDMTPTTPSALPFPASNKSSSNVPEIRTQPPSPQTAMPPSPIAPLDQSFGLTPPFGDDSSSYASDGSMGSSSKSSKSRLGRAKRIFNRGLKSDNESSAVSDSECQPASWKHSYYKEHNTHKSPNTEIIVQPPSPTELKPDPEILKEVQKSLGHAGHRRQAIRTSSLNLGKEGKKLRDKSKKRDKSASRSSELNSGPHSAVSGSRKGDPDDDDDDDDDDDEDDNDTFNVLSKKNKLERWCSFKQTTKTNGGPKANNTLPDKPPVVNSEEETPSIFTLSCGQLQILKKLGLLRLTAIMECHSPTHKTGWNWELPKLIRKIKTPDYKDKTVFGVPLSVSLQRTGHALPKPIQCALNWLKRNALDQMGIFRKAGVKSRITRLRTMVESAADMNNPFAAENLHVNEPDQLSLNFDGAQAHDVADMVKQYFRELPDALLTNKLSETFIAIIQFCPAHARLEALQCALLLLPEENLEVLYSLLIFLNEVAQMSEVNQMTASNLAVCLAPTLIRLHHVPPQSGSTKEGNSNRMVMWDNLADQRQICESRAAQGCLMVLIEENEKLFHTPKKMLSRCRFNYFEESIPVTLDELGSDFHQDWTGFQLACIKGLLKEAKEKIRGWISMSGSPAHVDLSYKKVGDGHPLRLWRATTVVEAPPQEVLQRILRERHIWDDCLISCRVIDRLTPTAEVYHYVTLEDSNSPARDYCVLRSWEQSSDICGRGWYAVAETSIAHGPPPTVGIRAVVLAARYLVRPAGKGRSRLVYLARIDTMGRTPDWYNKFYGFICSIYLARIRASFKHTSEGPESNV